MNEAEATTTDPTQEEILMFPASLAQEVFSFLDQLEPGNPAFNVAVRFHLAGPLDIPLLERSFNEMMQRHEILRTRLQEENGELMQVVLPSATISIEVIDISHLPELERKVEMERQGTFEAQKRFKFNSELMMRCNVVRLGAQEHMLQITIHHAISDGWSIGIITDEISTIYQAFAEGKPSPLPALPIQFADYTLWQRAYLKGPEIAAELAYWKRRLDGCTELNLPSDRLRPQVKSWSGDIVSIMLPPELTEKLKKLAHDNEATIFMVFLAAFKVMLTRYSGQTDIALGSPIAGRTKAEIEKLIGVFINTVILRTDLSGNPPFVETLRAVRETVLEAMTNQELPYELLVKEIHPVRDLNRNPLVQVNFTHQRDFVKPVKFSGITLTAIPSRSPGAIFDLHFFMVERDNIWRASCDYSTDLYDRETALRMLGHFQRLMVSIAAAPSTRIGALEMTTPEEQQRILIDWNATAREFPREKQIQELFEEQVRLAPGKLALRCGNETLTYSQLDDAANKLATHLRVLGANPGTLVGLCVERSVQMVVGVLAILKSGAAYVPMDPAFPKERLGYMAEDAELSFIITQSTLISLLPAHGAKVIELDRLRLEDKRGDAARRGTADDLAYIIFTSGSTGRPKGVQIQHRAVVNFLNSMQREPGCTANDVLLAVTTLSFDIAGLELFLPLITGATVVIATKETASNPQLLMEEMEKTATTILQATPVTWRMLLEAGWKGSSHLKALVGGESVGRDLVNQLAPICASLWNMYGPTETTIWSAVGHLEAGEGSVSIGRPIDNTQLYIVSPEMQLQPVGVPGELLIGGDGLALGYLKRSDLTAEKFISDPFGGKSHAKLYRTGDLARWNKNGTVECLGRIDHQVKIRGYRIELGEIESVLAQHEEVRQTVVVAQENASGEKRLVGYIIPTPGRSPTADAFSGYLRHKIPDYMIPAAFVLLKEFPLTPNGKIDKKALPKADGQNTTSSIGVIVAPRNPTEERLLAIFSEVLEAQVASVDGNFFSLGGHSLLAVKLMRKIENEFGVRIPLARLFNSPTVALLASDLADRNSIRTQWDALVPLHPRAGKPTLFFVHGAGGNLLLYRELSEALAPDISTYGFQSLGLDRKVPPLTTVKEMAERYVEELRVFQPAGPYYLSGYCMGGAVCYEMARILKKQKQPVGMVGLLDSYNLNVVKDAREQGGQISFLKQKIGFHFNNLTQLGAKDAMGYLSEKLRMAKEAGLAKVAARLEQLKGAVNGSMEESGTEQFIQEINHQAGWDFVPEPSDVQLTAFRPKKNYDFFSDPNMGWTPVVGENIEIVATSANPHAMLIEPYVREIAEHMRTRILGGSLTPPHSGTPAT